MKAVRARLLRQKNIYLIDWVWGREMATSFLRRHSVFFFINALLWGAVQSFAVDLDVVGAKTRYEAQRQKANLAKSRYQALENHYNDAKNRLAQAEREETLARTKLSSDEQGLAGIENSISRLERDISELQSALQKHQSSLDQVRSSIGKEEQNKSELERRKSNMEREKTRLEDKIQEMQSRPNPPLEEIAELKGLLNQLQQNLNQVNQGLNDTTWKIHNLQNEERNLANQISVTQQSLRENQLNLSSAQRDRDRQLRQIENDREVLRSCVNRTFQAESEFNQVRRNFELAKAEWEQEEKGAADLYAYYQTVLNNYNKALAEVFSRADSAANAHSFKEANERAPENGKAAGLEAAIKLGTEKGSKDGSARDVARGYKEGREKASSDPSLLQPYTKGLKDGADYADNKARLENFPLGYNDAKKAHFNGVPSQANLIDITENLPSNPGGNGVFLKLSDKIIGQKPAPSVVAPVEPAATPPEFSFLTPAIPAALNLYYNPPCSDLVLLEFEPLCRDRYAKAYQDRFMINYDSLFNQNARLIFEENVSALYQQAYAKPNLASVAQGQLSGATDQGLLDGYSQKLANAQHTEYAQGVKVFRADLSNGAYLVFRSAELEETNGDGVFTPGESVRLKIVLDNYGFQETALEKVRVRIRSSQGINLLNILLRGLPALAADTRTTLLGVLNAPITTQVVGEKIAFSGNLEIEENGIWKLLAGLDLQKQTHYPLELSEIILPKDSKVDETVTAQLRFVNRLSRESESKKGTISTDPQVITFQKPEFEIPKLEASAAVDLPIELTPGVWVGENTLTRFVAQLALDSQLSSRQVLSQFVHLDRTVAVLLFDQQGRPIPEGVLTVTAGSTLYLLPQMLYQAKTSLPGPFILRAGKTSDPKIPFGNGSAVSTNYGSLSPNTPLSKMQVSYVIPQEYKGKRGWVTFQAEEGTKVRHAIMLSLEVK